MFPSFSQVVQDIETTLVLITASEPKMHCALAETNKISQEQVKHDHEWRTENISRELFDLPVLFDEPVKR